MNLGVVRRGKMLSELVKENKKKRWESCFWGKKEGCWLGKGK